MAKRMVKMPVLERAMQFELKDIPEGSRAEGKEQELVRVRMSISSDAPYVVPYWGYKEVLGHREGEVELGRAQSGLMPVLFNHWPDMQLGAFESGSFKLEGGKRLDGTAVFSRSQLAQEKLQEVRDGLLGSTSVRYRVKKYERVKELDEVDPETKEVTIKAYRAVKWEPLEGSLVGIPADATVGVGRAAMRGAESQEFDVEFNDFEEGSRAEPEPNTTRERGLQMDKNDKSGVPAPAELDQVRTEGKTEGTTGERQRVAELMAVGDKFHVKRELVQEHIKKGTGVQEFRDIVWTQLGQINPENLIRSEDPNLGFTDSELRQFSITRAINAAVTGNWKKAGYEHEVSEKTREMTGKHGPTDRRGEMGFTLPFGMLRNLPAEILAVEINSAKAAGDSKRYLELVKQLPADLQRDLLAGSGSGASLVATELMISDFIGLLRPLAAVIGAGARVLPGLTGNIAFPRMTAGATASWVAEGNAASETTHTIGQLLMAPKNLTANQDLSRTLLAQQEAAEGIVRADFAAAIATAIDLAALSGAGAPAPTGIAGTSGVGSVSMGSPNGGAPSLAGMLEFQTDVGQSNGYRGALAFLINWLTYSKLVRTDIGTDTGVRLWNLNTPETPILGERAFRTTQCRSNLVEGTSGSTLSEIFFGNFNEVFLGFWGAMEFIVDPFTNSKSGLVGVTVWQHADVGVRTPGSFAYCADAITT